VTNDIRPLYGLTIVSVLLWNVRDLRISWMNAIVNRMNEYLSAEEPQYSKLEWKKFMDNYKGLTLKCRKYMDYPTVEVAINQR